MSGTPSTTPPSSLKAIFSLVLGLLAIICVPLNLFPAIPGLVLGLLGMREINRSGGAIAGKGMAITGVVLSSLGLLCGLGFAGAIPYGYFKIRDSANQARDRLMSVNNLKQIALAHHMYHDTYFHLPSAVPGPDGTSPLLSWRVAILPYIEEMSLHQRFDVHQAWDSPANRPLLTARPGLFMDPQQSQLAGDLTTYRVFVGPGTLYPVLTHRPTFAMIPDGTSNTILAVAATEGVPWSKPEGLDFIPGQTVSKLGAPGKDYFLAVTCDGAVRTIKKTISEETLRHAIDPADGMVLGPDW